MFPNKEQVEHIRRTYPVGTRVELTSALDDPHSKLTVGDRGTVTDVFDNGDLGVDWDAGSSLHLIPDHDSFRIVPCVSQKAKEQILKLRKMPDCPNMFSVNEVMRLANDNHFYDLICLIADDAKLYSNFILTGNTEK